MHPSLVLRLCAAAGDGSSPTRGRTGHSRASSVVWRSRSGCHVSESHWLRGGDVGDDMRSSSPVGQTGPWAESSWPMVRREGLIEREERIRCCCAIHRQDTHLYCVRSYDWCHSFSAAMNLNPKPNTYLSALSTTPHPPLLQSLVEGSSSCTDDFLTRC